MQVLNPSFEIVQALSYQEMLHIIESAYRICYASEPKGDSEEFIRTKMKLGHYTPLEHCIISVDFINDRGISHEQVRHRICSFSHESTRFCSYNKDKFGNEIKVISPIFFNREDLPTKAVDLPIPIYNDSKNKWELVSSETMLKMSKFDAWFIACLYAEYFYMLLLNMGATAQEARSVLPNSLATKIRITANLREWRLIMQQRALGTTGKPHPSMVEVMLPLLKEFKLRYPVFFDDLFI